MPISPEKMRLYPGGSIRSPEWLDLRARILARARHRCEQCGVRNRQLIYRFDGKPGWWMHIDGAVKDPDGGFHGLMRGSEAPAGKFVDVVLTIAHLDQDPTNNDPANLKALCQLDHNRLDAPHRRENARLTRRAKLASGELF